MTKTETAGTDFDDAFGSDGGRPVVREGPSEKRVYDPEKMNVREDNKEMTKPETQNTAVLVDTFVIRVSSFLRHSSFVIRHTPHA